MPENGSLVFKNARIITPIRVINNGVLIVKGGEVSMEQRGAQNPRFLKNPQPDQCNLSGCSCCH